MGHLLEVRNLTTLFETASGVVQAVDDISYYIDEGEIVGLVGESGCGKSVSQLSVLQLIPSPPGRIVGGEVLFQGQDLLELKADSQQMRSIRGGSIGIVFQEPMTSLNPVLTVGQQIIESVRLHLGLGRDAARERSIELLNLVGIPDPRHRIDYFPHQLSGGMRQRVMIAMAISCNPNLLIADEATTSLDVTTQAELLEILQDAVKHFNTSLLIVTHNLGVVARYVQRIYVMYAGRIVESGTSKEIFGSPRHPYTAGLLKSVPRLNEPKGHKLVPIAGITPSLINRSSECAFLPRCEISIQNCQHTPWPKMKLIDGQHYVSCNVSLLQGSAVPHEPENVRRSPPGELSSLPGAFLDPGAKASRSGYDQLGSDYSAFLHARAENALEKQSEAWSSNNSSRLPDSSRQNDVLLEVKDLKMYFSVQRGLLRRKAAEVKAIDGVSFRLKKGETLGLVGETGCGKTTIGRCVLRLYRPSDGKILFQGQDISDLPKSKVRHFRRNMSLIFQDPYGSLDPRQSAGSIVGEPLKTHHLVKSNAEYVRRVSELFCMVGLEPDLADRVPHEFSGGQRQRIAIARALGCNPSLVVCDEPVSALDVSIQAQIINLLEELQDELGLAYLFVAHDLSVVRHISDRVAVMYSGRIVELTDCDSLYSNPLHPYTQALLSAVPIPDPLLEEQRDRIVLKGEVPSALNPPSGCAFHGRCPNAVKDCGHLIPTLREVSRGHQVACSLI